MKCIICGSETGSRNDTCSGQCWVKALQQSEVRSKGEFIEITEENDWKDTR